MSLLQHDCPHCKTAKVALHVGNIAQVEGKNFEWDVSLLCPGCNRLSVATLLERNRQGRQPQGGKALINEYFDVRDFHPRPPSISAPRHCKDLVAKTYEQAMRAMHAGAWMPAAMAMRKVLEVATKDLDPTLEKLSLDQRIDSLHKAGRLPDGLRSFAHVIRLDGNDAVHDADETDEEEAKQLQDFVELFLRYVYTLPGEVLQAISRHPKLANKLAQSGAVKS